MKIKHYCIAALTIIAFVGTIVLLKGNSPTEIVNNIVNAQDKQDKQLDRLKLKADTLKLFCEKNKYNTDFCFLIDFSIHSGKKRIFVWDFKGDSIKYGGLVCHGYGLESTQSKPVFSNKEGSYCSSLGKYKIGVRAHSSWGINVHYKMHGLEKTNSNAFKRIVVLHSHTPVPNFQTYPVHLPLGYSQGCPVISNDLMKKVDLLLKNTKKPPIMWIYK